jgi:signal transduction histidine kinase
MTTGTQRWLTARSVCHHAGPAAAVPFDFVERSVLQGLAAFRWGAWLWMATVLTVSRDDLRRPWLAVGLVAVALAVTVADTILLRADPGALLRPGPVAAELAVGAALVLCDGWAYGSDHAFSTSQSLGSVWPLAGILGTGVALGPLAAAGAGVAVGLARVGAVVANGASIDSGGRVLSLTNTVVFYALGGAAGGYVARLLRRAERQISAARAREEVARTLHDGVLQTLAVVERRATDPALARLAREQERELREYLFGVAGEQGGGDLGSALRAAAARYEDAFGGRAQVIVADDLPSMAEERVAALAGAVGEALMNAGKHGGATKVTVYVEPATDGGVFCSVKDDGAGFDPAATPAGQGLTRSIRGRMEEAGGRVDVNSRPGSGTEVCLWLP